MGQILARRLPMTATGLDFYHLGENVHKARRVIFGEDNPGGKEWAAGLLSQQWAALWQVAFN
jgi:hypothetical protein